MKKMDRNLRFSLMGLIAMILYYMLRDQANVPISLRLALGALATSLFLISLFGYLRNKKPPRK